MKKPLGMVVGVEVNVNSSDFYYMTGKLGGGEVIWAMAILVLGARSTKVTHAFIIMHTV